MLINYIKKGKKISKNILEHTKKKVTQLDTNNADVYPISYCYLDSSPEEGTKTHSDTPTQIFCAL